ncbi:hypothetical protein C0991_010428 [Blastosporella zonata]|nr:hypothetical protein C0991_010428 [Blastosporella zonata]
MEQSAVYQPLYSSVKEFLKEAEAKRLEEASAKLRNQRLVAEERKKEREVKITDRLPPPKRQRTGGWAPAPKTLFQKTRSDASKLQRNLYTRLAPPMPQNGKRLVVLPKAPTANMEFLPPTSGTSRVTVNNVIRRRPASTSTSAPATSSTSAPPTSSSSSSTAAAAPLLASSKSVPVVMGKSPSKTPLRSDASTPSQARPFMPPSQKKDPMASLFVPKHRAYSQLP